MFIVQGSHSPFLTKVLSLLHPGCSPVLRMLGEGRVQPLTEICFEGQEPGGDFPDAV